MASNPQTPKKDIPYPIVCPNAPKKPFTPLMDTIVGSPAPSTPPMPQRQLVCPPAPMRPQSNNKIMLSDDRPHSVKRNLFPAD